MTRITATLVALLIPATGYAASIDIGRGSVPLVIPANYTEDKPVPLVILVHG